MWTSTCDAPWWWLPPPFCGSTRTHCRAHTQYGSIHMANFESIRLPVGNLLDDSCNFLYCTSCEVLTKGVAREWFVVSLCEFKTGIRGVLCPSVSVCCECCVRVCMIWMAYFWVILSVSWLVVFTSCAIIAIISQKSSEIKHLHHFCCVFTSNIE